MASQKGKLYLIPAPLGENAVHTIPPYVISILHELNFFIAERAKTARHFIKETNPVKPFAELVFSELNKHTDPAALKSMLQAALRGQDVGLLSEAGCPGVADPGARIVQLAHELGIEVVPLVGPSSILLALMASGMNGQSFAFQGYLPAKRPDLARELKQLEQVSGRLHQTQIMIETPYRNQAFIETALENLRPDTLLGIATDLTLPTQYVCTRTINAWKQQALPDLHKRPTIFLIYRP